MWYDESGGVWHLRTFISNAIKNDTVSVTYGSNLIDCSQYGKDNNSVFNRITVYGKQESTNILLLATEESSASQTDLWVKENIINDASLTTMDEVREKAEVELAKGITPPIFGRFKSVGLHFIQPGEQVMFSIPNMNVAGYYTLGSITHQIGNSGWTTDLDVRKELSPLAALFREKVDIEEAAKPFKNLNDMKDSYTVYFSETPDAVLMTNCEIVDGILQISSGSSQATAVSSIITADYDITACEFRKYVNYPYDQLDTYEVTNDGGTTWEDINVASGLIHTFSSTGRGLGFRITLNRTLSSDPTPAYESVCLLYK